MDCSFGGDAWIVHTFGPARVFLAEISGCGGFGRTPSRHRPGRTPCDCRTPPTVAPLSDGRTHRWWPKPLTIPDLSTPLESARRELSNAMSNVGNLGVTRATWWPEASRSCLDRHGRLQPDTRAPTDVCFEQPRHVKSFTQFPINHRGSSAFRHKISTMQARAH